MNQPAESFRKAARFSHHRGFTLIELLVVISIISLLISILLPALQGAREAAQNMQCLSNQRQMGVGFSLYHNDFDETVMPLGYLYGVWHGAIDRYVGGEGYLYYTRATTSDIFRCPSVDNTPLIDGVHTRTIAGEHTGYPGNRYPHAEFNNNDVRVRVSDVRLPSRLVLVVETNRDKVGRSNTGPGAWGYPEHRFRGHAGGNSNGLFLDMHAEVIPEEHPLLTSAVWWDRTRQ